MAPSTPLSASQAAAHPRARGRLGLPYAASGGSTRTVMISVPWYCWWFTDVA